MLAFGAVYSYMLWKFDTCAFVTRFCLSFPSEMFASSTCISVYILGGAEILVGSSFLWESYLTSLLCQFFIPLEQQKWFMAQVPEIVYKPLFNGMQTNLCYVLFLILAKVIIYWELTSGCESVWDQMENSSCFPLQKKNVVFTDHFLRSASSPP